MATRMTLEQLLRCERVPKGPVSFDDEGKTVEGLVMFLVQACIGAVAELSPRPRTMMANIATMLGVVHDIPTPLRAELVRTLLADDSKPYLPLVQWPDTLPCTIAAIKQSMVAVEGDELNIRNHPLYPELLHLVLEAVSSRDVHGRFLYMTLDDIRNLERLWQVVHTFGPVVRAKVTDVVNWWVGRVAAGTPLPNPIVDLLPTLGSLVGLVSTAAVVEWGMGMEWGRTNDNNDANDPESRLGFHVTLVDMASKSELGNCEAPSWATFRGVGPCASCCTTCMTWRTCTSTGTPTCPRPCSARASCVRTVPSGTSPPCSPCVSCPCGWSPGPCRC